MVRLLAPLGARRRGRLLLPVLLGLLALSPVVRLDPDRLAVVGQTVTAVVMAVLLVTGVRRGGALRRYQLLLLLAMASGLASAVVRLAYQLSTGRLPSALWATDVISLVWVPLVSGALLCLPAAESRQGFRVRALFDGLLAASSLWYLLQGLGVLAALEGVQLSAAHQAQLVANPFGDVFVVATALTVFAHCRPQHRRLVGFTLAGLTTIACGDLLFAIPVHGQLPSPGSRAGLVNQLGMLLLVAAAASVRGAEEGRVSRTPQRALPVAEGLPFTPLVGCIALTSRMVLAGDGMPQAQVLPALCVAIALMGRQLAGARDRERLVQALRARERDLEAEVRRDALTGLGNRTQLVEALSDALADPDQWPVTVALLDLNDFKLINDNHGHETGDAVLVEVASRLSESVRAGDTVARLGGDEFAVVATCVGDGGAALGGRLLAAFDAPVSVGAQTFGVRASVGLVNGQEGQSSAVALACADVAMYEAKDRRTSGSGLAVLTTDGRARASRRLRLQEALSDPQLEQFAMAYQPVIELDSGRIRGMEALLRWTHPTLGSIPPDVFIPLAERAGTIGRLGEFALTTALADLAALQARVPQRLAVGVNVAPAQLTDAGFRDRVLALVRLRGLEPDQLNLEITEQAFEANLEAVAASVDAFVSAGISVAVDDFGTGYSSLQYLQRLPVDVMKIDRSFVWEAESSPRARRLLSSLVSLASGLDLQLVAEGIETEEQRTLLRDMGCELGQGYLFSRPVPFAELSELVRAQAAVAPVPSPRVPVTTSPAPSPTR